MLGCRCSLSRLVSRVGVRLKCRLGCICRRGRLGGRLRDMLGGRCSISRLGCWVGGRLGCRLVDICRRGRLWVRLRGRVGGTCSICRLVNRLGVARYIIPIILILVKYCVYLCCDSIQYRGYESITMNSSYHINYDHISKISIIRMPRHRLI